MHWIAIIVIFIFAAGCSSDPAPGHDSGHDAGHDVAIAPDVSDEETAPEVDTGPRACALQGDCATSEVCIDQQCQPSPECTGYEDWQSCARTFAEVDPELGLRATCGVGGYCIIACLEDSDCATGESCTDYGLCVPYGGDLTAPPPGGGARSDLRAGVGNVLLNFPIGVSMAGYGSRVDSTKTRYTGALGPSVGAYHGLYARATALDNGEHAMLIVRLPIVFASASLHEAVARRLHDLTGQNWRNNLIISATHTHSGPARFWPLPVEGAIDIGRLGADSYHHAIFDWIAESTFEAAAAALDDLRPARLGWTIVEAYDTDDAIAADRWAASPPFDDNRALLIRIDDDAGVPFGGLISLGIHSTFNDGNYLTTDAAGALEHALEADFGQRYGRFVPVMFMSQNGGTMSPRGGGHGHDALHRHDYIGYEFARRVVQRFDEIETTADLDLASHTHYFPITYTRVGYQLGEWTPPHQRSVANTYYYGAMQCLNNGDTDYETHMEPFSKLCIPLSLITSNRPPTVFTRSITSALRLGDLTIVTIPGEVSMEVGWQVLREARDRYGVDPLSSFIWGYAQDHQLYITPTNLRGELPPFPGISTPMAPDDYPDYAFSWLQGGYEAQLSAWGHLFGDFMVARAIDALHHLEDPATAPASEALPLEFTPFRTDAFPIEPSPVDAVGEVVTAVSETVPRLQPMEFGWVGGDPGVEMPQTPEVALQRQTAPGVFEPVVRVNHRPYTNREPVMATRVRQNADRWEWVAYWEELHDFPLGTYRFVVRGHHDVDGARTPYTVTSDSFEVVATTIDANVTTSGATASGTLSYPAGAPLTAQPTAEDPGRVEGTLRMRHPDTPSGQLGAVEVGDIVTFEARIMDGSTVWQTLGPGEANLTTTATVPRRTTFSVDLSGAPAGASVVVHAVDRFGNATP